jgi:hypothetical protein
MLSHTKLKIAASILIFSASSLSHAVSLDQWNQFATIFQKAEKWEDELTNLRSRISYTLYLKNLQCILADFKSLKAIKPACETSLDIEFKKIVNELHAALDEAYAILSTHKSIKDIKTIIARMQASKFIQPYKECTFELAIKKIDARLTTLVNMALKQSELVLASKMECFKKTLIDTLNKKKTTKTSGAYFTGLMYRLSCK